MQKSEEVTSLCVPGDSEGDEEETTQDEVSSHTSEEDGGVVKVEKELENAEQPVGGNSVVEHEASDKWLLSPGTSLPFYSAQDASLPHVTLLPLRVPWASYEACLPSQHELPKPQTHSSLHTQLSFSTHISLHSHTALLPKAPHFFPAEHPSLQNY